MSRPAKQKEADLRGFSNQKLYLTRLLQGRDRRETTHDGRRRKANTNLERWTWDYARPLRYSSTQCVAKNIKSLDRRNEIQHAHAHPAYKKTTILHIRKNLQVPKSDNLVSPPGPPGPLSRGKYELGDAKRASRHCETFPIPHMHLKGIRSRSASRSGVPH